MVVRESPENEPRWRVYVLEMAEHNHESDGESLAAALMVFGRSRRYPPRSYVFHEHDTAASVMIIENGLVRIDRTTAVGKVVLINLVAAGDLFGELAVIDGEPRSASASTVTESVIHVVPAHDFQNLLIERADLHAALLRSVAQRLRGLTTQFVETSSMDAPSRVAARLLQLVEIEQSLGRCSVAADGSVDLRLPISQEELGQWCGLSREGTVKGISVLRSLDLLTTGRKRVHIRDLTSLQSAAQ